jgi:DNA-directed RNA polymerase specialized sigma24 family protein
MKTDLTRSGRQHRARTLRVDFQDITSNSEACLTEFEKSVLDNVRDLKSNPRDQLIVEEKALEKKKKAIQDLRRLRRYVKYARLTPKQKQAYKLFFMTKRSNMTLRKLAQKLDISLSSAWARLHGALLHLEKIKLRREEGERLRRNLGAFLYVRKLRKVRHLYFERCWPPPMIARSLGSKLSTIYDNIRTIRTLGYIYSQKEYTPWKEAQKKSRIL